MLKVLFSLHEGWTMAISTTKSLWMKEEKISEFLFKISCWRVLWLCHQEIKFT